MRYRQSRLSLRGWAATCALATVLLTGCGPQNPANDPNSQVAAQQRVEQRIAGVWRLMSYVPESQLSPVLLFTMQADNISVRFEDGKIQSMTSGMDLDRAYRLADVEGSKFKIFIQDGQGVEHESQCQFDQGNRILFYTVTPPWRGRGVLEREGPAMSARAQ